MYYRTICNPGKRERVKPVKPVGSSSIRSDDASCGSQISVGVETRIVLYLAWQREEHRVCAVRAGLVCVRMSPACPAPLLAEGSNLFTAHGPGGEVWQVGGSVNLHSSAKGACATGSSGSWAQQPGQRSTSGGAHTGSQGNHAPRSCFEVLEKESRRSLEAHETSMC